MSSSHSTGTNALSIWVRALSAAGLLLPSSQLHAEVIRLACVFSGAAPTTAGYYIDTTLSTVNGVKASTFSVDVDSVRWETADSGTLLQVHFNRRSGVLTIEKRVGTQPTSTISGSCKPASGKMLY